MKKLKDKDKHFKLGLYLSIFFILLYFVLFGKSGFIIQKHLEEKKARLSSLSKSLQMEQEKLKRKYDLLQDENNALEIEGKKYMLLSDNSKILRFVEPSQENQNPLDATYTEKSSSISSLRGQQIETSSAIVASENTTIWRDVYIITVVLILVILYLIRNDSLLQLLSEFYKNSTKRLAERFVKRSGKNSGRSSEKNIYPQRLFQDFRQ